MIKQKIKQFLVDRRDEQYRRELREKRTAYHNWYRYHKQELTKELRAADHAAGQSLSLEVVRYSHLKKYILSGKTMPDIIVACDDQGTLTDYAQTMIRDFFAENRESSLVYGDEDRVDESGELQDPWFKSDWAPDTFLSTFYFGSVFAFRSAALGMINPGERRAADIESQAAMREDDDEERASAANEPDDGLRAWIYGQLCLKLAQADGGFSVRNGNRFPIGHIPEILFHRSRPAESWDGHLIKDSLTRRYSSDSAAMRMVSIVIPSKDNPEVLENCIRSIEKCTETAPYEIIVVDNGSSPENRRRVEELLQRHNEIGSARYLYEPMEFNFSRMCNLGAAAADGELLLFLNDDIEVRKNGWLSYLSEKAKLPYVGAVGMKLLYPNSDIIQHAGVVNVRVGPYHKLQYCSNAEEHYFGFNKGVRNVLAVTGACLMVRKSLFDEVGGFDAEHFAVAFNDIDLCYRIYEKGYYNVVRNNMYLYHHESLSRGDDRKDEVKSLRLSREQRALLLAHPALFGKDPFYHKYLTQNPVQTRFVVDIEEEYLKNLTFVTPRQLKKALPQAWTDACLRLGVEYANSLAEWYDGPFAGDDDKGYYLKGYSFVIGADNAVYDRELLLKAQDGTGNVYALPVMSTYRPDIAANLTDQINDELTGFFAMMREGLIPAGRYLVGMLCADRTSRQRIVNWSDVYLQVR
ncbi:MAG: glycosyltransferase [Eubacteriales bacterium]|nr:glycosyltransferase [Eubacteriales bacterium]